MLPQPMGNGSTRAGGGLEHSHRGGKEGTCEHKQEREMKDSPQKPPGWEKIWSWGADMGSSSCSLPRGTA